MAPKNFKRTHSNETRFLASIRKQINLAKESKIHKWNLIIVTASLIVSVLFVLLGYIILGIHWGDSEALSDNLNVNPDHSGGFWFDDAGELFVSSWVYLFVIPACGIATYAGIVAVIASNNKSPVKFLLLSTVTIVYRIAYVITQVITQSQDGGAINATLLLGQPAFFLMLLGQTYLWIRWNNNGSDGKFQSEALTGTRAKIAWTIVAIVIIVLFLFSIVSNLILGKGEKIDVVVIFMDVIPSASYMIGAILNAFGNILCYPFFFVGNLGWFYFGVTNIFENHEPLMTIIAISTMLQAVGLNALLVTGFIQWFHEDFTWIKGEGIKPKLKEVTQENQITQN